MSEDKPDEPKVPDRATPVRHKRVTSADLAKALDALGLTPYTNRLESVVLLPAGGLVVVHTANSDGTTTTHSIAVGR